MSEDYDWADELERCLPIGTANLNAPLLEAQLNDQEYLTEPEESITFSSIPIATADTTGYAYFVMNAAVAATYAALTRSTTPAWRSTYTW